MYSDLKQIGVLLTMRWTIGITAVHDDKVFCEYFPVRTWLRHRHWVCGEASGRIVKWVESGRTQGRVTGHYSHSPRLGQARGWMTHVRDLRGGGAPTLLNTSCRALSLSLLSPLPSPQLSTLQAFYYSSLVSNACITARHRIVKRVIFKSCSWSN